MTATTPRIAGATGAKTTGVATTLFAVLIGAAIIFVGGHVQATTLHAAAHDVRHATGFPCH
ncbi:CbtB domain-containing protein [Sulfitobacter sp. D35]|uniref:CbtB domain-containing protein n=1 Tax=Sulfitobacter sp. D35 TaxID=3083252 RepID=UPI00296E6747|nr:CbtB domain-containing protein [Sulfitobacter sp. D35]MDW4496470.1 CbtB domain-containing protein [Sulfitobacter sp. D35]